MTCVSLRRALLALTILAAPLSVPTAQAQTLSEAATLAVTSNPQLQAARARLEGTREQIVQARAQGRLSATADASTSAQAAWARSGGGGGGIIIGPDGQPIVTGGGGGDGLNFSESFPINASVSASQPFYLGGRLRAALDEAEATVGQAQAQLLGLEITVLQNVVTAFSDVRQLEEVVRIRQNNVAVLEKQLEAANARFEVGEVTKTDVAQAQARLAAARSDLVGAGAQLSTARAAYARVVGDMPGTLSEPPPIPTLPASLDDALSQARAASPTLAAARFTEAAAEAAARAAKAQNSATASLTTGLSARGDFSRDNSDQYGASLGVRVSVPLFTGGLNESRTRAALANASAARISVLDTDRQITEQVTNAWRNYEAAQAVIVSSREQVAAAEIAYEGAELELQVGLRTTLDVLNQEQELLNARLALVSAQRNAYVAAHGLLAAIGRLTPDVLGATRPASATPPPGRYAEPLAIERPLLGLTDRPASQ